MLCYHIITETKKTKKTNGGKQNEEINKDTVSMYRGNEERY